MKNMRMFKVSFKGPTDHSGSRAIIYDTRHEKRLTVSKDYSMDYDKQLTRLFKDLKIKITGRTSLYNVDYWFTEDFETQIK